MKVLTIMTSKFTIDGITNVVRNYYKFIDKNQFEVDFVFPNNPSEDFLTLVEDNDGEVFVLSNRNSNPIKYMKKLIRIMSNTEYDIIHAHGNSHTLAIEMLAAKISNIPVRIPHSHNTTTKNATLHKILSIPFNMSYTNGLSCGIDAGEWLFGENKFEVIDNGIEVDNYKFSDSLRLKKRQSLSYTADDKIIGHIGHFSEQKNQEYLIHLFSKLVKYDPNYKLLLIGDGKLRESLEDKVEELKLIEKIKFIGKRNDIPELLSAIDLIVMPSLYEGLPLTLIEAQAADLNSVISDKITQEVDITGRVVYFNLNDKSSDILNKIEDSIQQKQERSEHECYNLVKESKYNIEVAVKKLENLYIEYYESEIVERSH